MKQTKPKVIISTYDDIQNPHYGGGGAIAVHKVAKHLTGKYDVTVLCWDYSGKKKEVIDGVMYERFGFPFMSPKIAMIVYQTLLFTQVLTKKFDLWLESYCPPFTTAMLPLFTKKPVIGIVHMLASEDMERKYKMPFHLIEHLGLRRYKHIIVTSHPLKEKLLKIHKKAAIAVISNGIDKVFEKSVRNKKYILYLGRIEIDQKGIDLLIPAFKRFNKTQNNEYSLVIAGDGDTGEVERVKALVEKLQIKSHVLFTGRVSGTQKTSLFRHASSVIVSSRFETFSLVSLEAFAHNTPLICFDIKGLSWIPENMAIKVKPFSSISLANAMKEVALNKTKKKKMVLAGNKYAKKYTWKSISKKYEETIQTAMSSFSSYVTYITLIEL